jgi:hypothetical protein
MKASTKSRKPSPNFTHDQVTGTVRFRPREKLLERQPITEGRIAAFDKVHEKLAVATELYEHFGDGGKSGAYRAVIDVIDYFSSRGIPYSALAPLQAIAQAIVDADQGTSSPIFKPNRRGGGAPPKSAGQLSFEGQLAVVMECCVRHYKSEGKRPFLKPASIMAARLIKKSNWPVSPSAVNLREIRERISRKERLAPDRVTYEALIGSPLAETAPLDYANALLKNEHVIAPPS